MRIEIIIWERRALNWKCTFWYLLEQLNELADYINIFKTMACFISIIAI